MRDSKKKGEGFIPLLAIRLV